MDSVPPLPRRSFLGAGLLLAGPCFGGVYFAHASYRVVDNAVAMGEPTGTTAAVAARTQRPPHKVRWCNVVPVCDPAQPSGRLN